MQSYKIPFLFLFILLVNSEFGLAQIRLDQNTAKPLIIEFIPEVKSPHQNSIYPLFAGQTFEAKVVSKNRMEWVNSPKSDRLISQLEINNTDLAPLVFYFESVKLDVDALLYVYAKDFSKIHGPFTQKDIDENKAFVAGPISGSTIVVQLEKNSKGIADFNLNEIGVLNKEAANIAGFGTSGDCEVNVNCVEGNTLQNQKNGIARVLVKQGSSLFYCSGTLVNNTRRDFTPLFITANHCGKNATEEDYGQWLFHFNYEAESCDNPISEPDYYSVSGAQLLSKSTDNESTGSDFKLLLLSAELPASINPFFNGWNRLNNSSEYGYTIHHPDGDVKKVSTYNSQLVSTSYGGGGEDPEGKYWRVSWTATENGHGVTEGGSSGSPLFDSNGLIIGALTGGLSSCSELLAPDYYGKFSYSWESNGGGANQQLMPWLDPEFTGASTLSGLGYHPDELNAAFSADANALIIDQKAVFSNFSSGIITKYEWFFEGGEPESSLEKNPAEITYERPGQFDVRLIVSNELASDTLLLKNYVVVRPQIYPNPSTNKFYLDFGKQFPEELEVNLFDSYSRLVQFESYRLENKLVIVPGHFEKGLHLLNVINGENSQVFKIALY